MYTQFPHFSIIVSNFSGLFPSQPLGRSIDEVNSTNCEMVGCSPNVRKERVGRRLRFVTTRDIQTGEELCITYGHVEGMGLDERRKHLREGWFFDCQCARCTAEEGVRYSRPMERSNECKTPRQDSCQSLPICVARESADVGWAEGQGCQ